MWIAPVRIYWEGTKNVFKVKARTKNICRVPETGDAAGTTWGLMPTTEIFILRVEWIPAGALVCAANKRLSLQLLMTQ